jgi:23S rRNA pseudouridine1911/1915/1917 synthase
VERFTHKIDDDAGDVGRVDKYIAEHLDLVTRSQLKQRIQQIFINGKIAKLSRRVHAGDTLEIHFRQPEPLDILPEPIPLDILYESPDVLVVNKPQGMIVHPAGRISSGTLVNAVLHHCSGLKSRFEATEGFAGSFARPGIVHRLDRDTSGVLIVAKHPRAQEFLAAQFRKREVRKKYWAVVKGAPPESRGRIEALHCRDPRHRKKFTWRCRDGKKAVTHYRVLRSYADHALLALRPVTGRTHQLRVHCLSMNCPILGDKLYGRTDKAFPQAPMMLHAKSLSLVLPGKAERSTFRAPLPDHFRRILARLGSSPSAKRT